MHVHQQLRNSNPVTTCAVLCLPFVLENAPLQHAKRLFAADAAFNPYPLQQPMQSTKTILLVLGQP
jgi:hypothetical protein